MKPALIRCALATTITTISFSVSFAQQVNDATQQSVAPTTQAIFDDPTPSLEDNLPPDASAAEVAKELNDNTLEQVPTEPVIQPKIHQDMMPFNSKRVDLVEAMQNSPKSVVINGKTVALKHPERVAEFYKSEQYPTIWTHENEPNSLVSQLQKAIANSSDDALNPASYHQSIISHLQEGTNYQDIIALEILMSDAWLSLAGDLANGLVNPKVTSPTWNAKRVSDLELAGDLANGINAGDIITPLNNYNANDPRYQALKKFYLSSRKKGNTDKIVINMDRVRWMAQDWYKGRYIFVNIPAYEVKMVDGGKNIYVSRSVVGRTDRETPRFVDRLRHVVLAPTWTVPPTILQKDKLARLKSSPGSFDANFEVVAPGGKITKPSAINWKAVNPTSYTLRQKPGKNNALGVVKFLFPNKHAIYLHDTPSKGLFNQAYRAKSSGCIRLQKPLELANILLKGTNWTPTRIKATANSGKQQFVNPPRETPIYLVYWTTWADTDGKIRNVADDVYHLDKKLINAYEKALSK